jgi:hypothetical protein
MNKLSNMIMLSVIIFLVGGLFTSFIDKPLIDIGREAYDLVRECEAVIPRNQTCEYKIIATPTNIIEKDNG